MTYRSFVLIDQRLLLSSTALPSPATYRNDIWIFGGKMGLSESSNSNKRVEELHIPLD